MKPSSHGATALETTARVEKTMSASAATIWNALTNPALIKKYFFGADAQSDFRLGSPIRWTGDFKGKHFEDKGEILISDPGRELSMSHWSSLSGQPDSPENYHVVTYRLEPDGQSTKVILTQANLLGDTKPADIQNRAEYEKNWTAVLDGLEKVVNP